MAPVARESANVVFLGGRWRELPQGCSFAVSRNGRLAELRPVLVRYALSGLTKRQPSNARLGPTLAYKNVPPNEIGRASSEDTVIIAPKPTKEIENVRPSKRKFSTSSDETHNISTVAIIHTSKHMETQKCNPTKKILHTSPTKSISERPAKRRRPSSDIDEITVIKPPRSLRLKRKLRKSLSKEKSPILQSRLSEKQISKALGKRARKQSGSCNSESEMEELGQNGKKSKQPVSKQNNISINLDSEDEEPVAKKKRPNKHNLSTKKAIKETSDTNKTSQNKNLRNPKLVHNIFNSTPKTCKELRITEEDIELLRNFLKKNYSDEELLQFDMDNEYKKMHFYRINPLVEIEKCEQIDRMLRNNHDSITLTDFASKLGLRSVSETSSSKSRYKMRKKNNRSYVEASSSDDDDENNIEKSKKASMDRHSDRERVGKKREETEINKKKAVFKTINKTYVVESSSSDADDDIENDINKSKKTRDNRLERVREDKKREEEKDRNKKKINESYVVESSNSDNDVDKENNNEKSKKTTSDRTEHKKKEIEKEKAVKLNREKETGVRVDVTDTSKGAKVTKVSLLKKKPVISTKRNKLLNEYSCLEDQAIVAWVSTGGRASRVNGNALWRLLEEQITNLTGIRRTWHSLRNRYLRYILPRLGSLALPMSQQTRLRAAAATGELKARKAAQRRNSIFEPATRGAASRRIVTRDDDYNEIPSRPVRNASLTRPISQRQRQTSSDSHSSRDERAKTGATGTSSPRKRIAPDNNKSPQKTVIENGDSDSSELPRLVIDESSESEDESKRLKATESNRSKDTTRTTRTVPESKANESPRKSTKRKSRDSSDSSDSSNESDRRKSLRNRPDTNEPPRKSTKRKSRDSSDSSDSSNESDRRKAIRNRPDTTKSPRKLDSRNNLSSIHSNSSTISKTQSPLTKRGKFGLKTRRSSNSQSSNESMSRPSRKKLRRTVHSRSSSESMSHSRRKSQVNKRIESPKKQNESTKKRIESSKKRANRDSSASSVESINASNKRRKSKRVSQLNRLKSPEQRRKSNRLTKEKVNLKPLDPNESIDVSDSSVDYFESKKIVKPKKRILFNPKVLM